MLTQKKHKKNQLAAIVQPALKIVSSAPDSKVKKLPTKEDGYKYPPANQFNTGYLKPKKNDPL